MTADPGTSPLGNREKLAGLQSGEVASTPLSGERAKLPWEQDTVPSTFPSTAGPTSVGPTSPSNAGGQSSTGHAATLGTEPASPASVNPPLTSASATPPHQSPEVPHESGAAVGTRPLAPVWTRVWCYVLDQTLALLVGFLAAVVVSVLCALIGFDPSGAVASGIVVVVWIAVFVGYFAVGYAWWGRTPAMMGGRLHVVDPETGNRLPWGRAWLRAIVLGVQVVTGILTIIWLVVTASSPTRQGPHDRASRSIVLRAP